jgi:hypothetical protein
MTLNNWRILPALGVAAVILTVGVWHLASREPTEIKSAVTREARLPSDVSLHQIAGGPHYYADISEGSTWMDQHILIGGWLEQPMTATEVRYDVAMGNNIYWNLAYAPAGTKECKELPCRVGFNVIRAAGMHASAPDVTAQSGSETVSYEGTDEPDMIYGPGSSNWDSSLPVTPAACIPSGSKCGYTVANFYYTGKPSSDGPSEYQAGKKPITQGYGKGVLFWETPAQAAQFLNYSDTLSADSYWMSDPALSVPSQGGCTLLPLESTECEHWVGSGLSRAQRALPANYAFDVTRIQYLESLIGMSKPITVDVETGCPGESGSLCTTPPASVAAAWHALIAGARGIIWFQHNFGGPCVDYRTFYDGSNPKSLKYNCQQTPGVTLHDMVEAISAFNHEVDGLNRVLLSPFANNYASVGKADISTMVKCADGTFYVFAASGKPAEPPARDQSVTFRLAGGYTGPVTVVDENRTLRAVNGAFTDVFLNANSVHVYKIGDQ